MPRSRHPDDVRKWGFLLYAPTQDARHREVVRLAQALWLVAGGRLQMFLDLASALCRDAIRYERDTARVGAEDIAGYTREPRNGDAIEAWKRGVDDCDAKARLFVALCLAQGVRARMAPTWNEQGRLQHVSAEVYDGATWRPVELTLRRARVGDTPNEVPFERHSDDWLR